MTTADQNIIELTLDPAFHRVVTYIAQHITQSSQGKIQADVETTAKLLIMRGINDLAREQQRINPKFAEELTNMVSGKS